MGSGVFGETSSPEIKLGSSVSRRAVRVQDSSAAFHCLSMSGSAMESNAPMSALGGAAE
jgi:hypothetical protein